MKHVFRPILTGVLSSLLVSMTTMAQSSDLDEIARESGPEARVTLTVPFGPVSKTAKDDSRLEFGIRQYQRRSNDFNWALNQNAQIYGDDFSESRIGFTLSENPSLMLNGQEWIEMNAQLGIDREDVGTGLGTAAIVVTVAVVAVATVCLTSGCIPYDCEPGDDCG